MIDRKVALDTLAREELGLDPGHRLRPGGRVVMADVVIPDDPRDVVTPVVPPHDKPSPAVDQLS